MTFEEFKSNVESWAEERGIYKHSTSQAQLLKTLTELGELADAVIKGDKDGLKDAIGDVAVCIINYAKMLNLEDSAALHEPDFFKFNDDNTVFTHIGSISEMAGELLQGGGKTGYSMHILCGLVGIAKKENLDFMYCCELSWNEIKNRKGRMVAGGAFVKDEEAK